MMNYNKLLKNVTKEEAEQALYKIHEIQELDSKYIKSFFWTSGRNAYIRRAREFERDIEFTLNGNKFLYSCSYRESSRHCYYHKKVFFNEEQITMRTINTLEQKLTNIMKEMSTDNE